MDAHERKCASLSMTTINLKSLKHKKGAIKSTLTTNGLPTGVVEKHYDIKLSNIQHISLNFREITSDSKKFLMRVFTPVTVLILNRGTMLLRHAK